MSDTDTLSLWHERRRVGQLWRNPAGAIGFRYDPEWIVGGGFAVSRSLPLATGEFAPGEGSAERWFANLLPEGAVREHIVRDLKLPNTDFDLLRAIGGECAGALSILPAEQQPSDQRRYRPLTEKDLAGLAARRGQIYAAWPADERPRLSLAGAQDNMLTGSKAGNFNGPMRGRPMSRATTRWIRSRARRAQGRRANRSNIRNSVQYHGMTSRYHGILRPAVCAGPRNVGQSPG